jgi:hypothetical protein
VLASISFQDGAHDDRICLRPEHASNEWRARKAPEQIGLGGLATSPPLRTPWRGLSLSRKRYANWRRTIRENRLVDTRKVKEHCDTLRDLIGVGPGDNPEILRKALSIVRSLRVAAEWDYPRQIIEGLKVRLLAWFSYRQWRGDDAELRRSLLQHVDQLPHSWKQPAGD